MGANICKKSKTKVPKRGAPNELVEKEKAGVVSEKADAGCKALKEAEEAAARLAAVKAEEAEAQRLQEEAKQKSEEEARKKSEEEARHKLEEEARQKLEEEATRIKEAEARRAAEEESEARRRAEAEERKKAEDKSAPAVVVVPCSASPDVSHHGEMTPNEKFDKLSDKDDISSETTMSTQVAGVVKTLPKGKTIEMTQGSTPITARSMQHCDMTSIDKPVKKMSMLCGCDFDADHKEFKCSICKSIDLSDAPLLD